MTSTDALEFLIRQSLQASLLLAIAWSAAALCRRRSAALRHLIWTTALVGILLLPAFSLIPSRSLRVEVPLPLLGSFVQEDARPYVSERRELAREDPSAAVGAARPGDDEVTARLPAAIIVVWLAGALAVLARFVVDSVRMAGIVRRATTVDTLTCFGAARPTSVRTSHEITSPMVAGLLRSVVLIPRECASGADAEALPAVLAHETAHIERRDIFMSVLGRVVCACHWFNPLVWRAGRAMRLEAEQACDDRALLSGFAAVDYANVLLATAARGRGTVDPLLPMAAAHDLEIRLKAILQPATSRQPCTLGNAITVGSIAVVLVGVAGSLRLDAQRPLAASLPTPALVVAPRLALAPTPAAAPSGKASGAPEPAFAGPDERLTRILIEATSQAPLHAFDFVAQRAKWALSQARGGQLIAPLIDRLHSADPQEVSYAAWSLAYADPSLVVDALIEVMHHEEWRVRAEAAAALSRFADARATDVMRRALADPAWQVRLEAVQFFAALGDERSVELVRSLQQDPHIGVRSNVEWVLHKYMERSR